MRSLNDRQEPWVTQQSVNRRADVPPEPGAPLAYRVRCIPVPAQQPLCRLYGVVLVVIVAQLRLQQVLPIARH
jgi:hypothetical protein